MKYTNSEFDSVGMANEALMTYFPYIADKQLIIVDVGAGQPEFYSNTFFFRSQNAKIISIDAMPRNIKMFEDMGYEILHYAVTETDEPNKVLFREFPNALEGLAGSTIASVADSTGHGTPIHLSESIQYEVPAKSLKTILKEHYPSIDHIDILNIDTEGNEIEILRGSNLEYYCPKVLIIENLSGKYDNMYSDLGYKIYAKCYHNDILIPIYK